MQLVAPDILADACGLSVGLVIVSVLLGLALWLLGWLYHRFWIVLVTTVLAGVYGLYDGALFRAQPLLSAVLLALVGGLLALALVRLLAFLAGGMAGLLIVQAVFPGVDPALCFLNCGLLSLFLFRLSTMAITSLAGAILLIYGALSLLNHYGTMDALAWSSERSVHLNWICGLLAVTGFVFQFLLDKRRSKNQTGDEKAKDTGSWDILLGRGVAWGFGKKVKKAG